MTTNEKELEEELNKVIRFLDEARAFDKLLKDFPKLDGKPSPKAAMKIYDEANN